MSIPILTLPKVDEDHTCPSILRQMYHTFFLNISNPTPAKTLNEQLGINVNLDKHFSTMDSFISNSRILFGVGNGGAVGSDLTVPNACIIGPATPDSSEPRLVTMTNPLGFTYRPTYNINNILPLKYSPGNIFNTKYGMLKRTMFESAMFNKYFLKLPRVNISEEVQEDGSPSHTILHIRCFLSSDEAFAKTTDGFGMVNYNEYIDEFVLYFAKSARIDLKENVIAGSYPTYTDYIQTAPFLYTSFDRIYRNQFPSEGLDFAFDFDLGITSLMANRSLIPGITVS